MKTNFAEKRGRIPVKISTGRGISVPSDVARPYASQTYNVSPAQKGEFSRRFDSVTISGEGNGRSSFALELKSLLSREVRVASSSGSAAVSLRDEVQSGAYQPDPAAIARKMLLLGEAG